MNLTVLTNLFPPEVLGGYELLAQDVYTRLKRKGHNVHVLTSGPDRIDPHVHRVLRLARPFGSRPPRRDRSRHLLAAAWNHQAVTNFINRSGRPDAVLVMSMRRLGVEPMRTFQRAGIPMVLTINDDWPVAFCAQHHQDGNRRSPLTWPLDHGPWARHAIRDMRFSHVVYLSDSIRRQVRDAIPWFPEGIVQAQGVDLNSFQRRAFRPMNQPLRLLFAGRLHPSKCPDIALEALANLRGRGVDATLDVAGAPVTDAYGRELRDLASSLKLDEHVSWLGHVPRAVLGDTYRRADVFLFLNRWQEPLGLTYMEAMACGVPVVAYPQGGAAELLDTWDATQRASELTGEAVADAVEILANSQDRQRKITERSATMLQEAASLDGYVNVLEQQLKEAAENTNGSKTR